MKGVKKMEPYLFEDEFYEKVSGLRSKSLSTVSFVESVEDSGDTIEIKLNSKTRVSSGSDVISNQIFRLVSEENPTVNLKFTQDLLDMEEDEDLIKKSKIPLWVMDHNKVKNTVLIKRVF